MKEFEYYTITRNIHRTYDNQLIVKDVQCTTIIEISKLVFLSSEIVKTIKKDRLCR